jgi:S-adenosylmethionine hydrolase
MDHGLRGEIIHIDHFGNLASNIRVEDLGEALDAKSRIVVRLNRTEINGMVDTFGERPVGGVIALLGSAGNLIISVVNGSASEKLGAKVGDVIEAVF